MTYIVGLVEEGRVFVGSDSIGSDGHRYSIRAEPKVFKRKTNHGEFLFGYTTSFRFGQLLQHALTIPSHPKRMSDHKYMVTRFINAVRKTFKDGGYSKKKDEAEKGGTALIGYHGKLWRMEEDYQIALADRQGDVVGSGVDGASGALCIIKDMDWPPKHKIKRALQAAEACIQSVRGPFKIISGAERKE